MSHRLASASLPRLVLTFVTALAVLVTLGLAIPAAQAKPGDWERIGVREVDGKVDRDVIPVTALEGRFEKIQLRVARASMEIYDLRIHYGDGTVQDVALRSNFAPGASSRLIDLEGGDRVISKLEFTYGNVGASRLPARLAVWGMH